MTDVTTDNIKILVNIVLLTTFRTNLDKVHQIYLQHAQLYIHNVHFASGFVSMQFLKTLLFKGPNGRLTTHTV